jgi:thioredoxin 1
MEQHQKSFSAIIAGDTPVLVDFFAEWCGPCKMMKPVLQELKAMTGEKAVILKVDVDKSPDMATRYRIQSVPTIMIFKRGNTVWRKSGVIPSGQLYQIISQYMT